MKASPHNLIPYVDLFVVGISICPLPSKLLLNLVAVITSRKKMNEVKYQRTIVGTAGVGLCMVVTVPPHLDRALEILQYVEWW
ncbi:hypothetical protein F5890DRAFT_1560479 [Lentinula detonsa]|uniref:Uncharacterized protein n=1 Tax=Lentinula detonsa TaxID=2804962 RepID=A0AA38PMK4_9AGAR|nr:hypothetical protein F5890DRAFT_1560479 [Lentinula detonsa]